MNFIDLKSQQLTELANGRTLRSLINDRISCVLDHGQYILGPEVNELESALASYVGASHCVCVSSGTDALLLALMSIGVQPGDEVITSPFSFVATAEVITLLGAHPVFVDIDPLTYNLDPDLLERAISNRTKAIIPVSLYGQPANFSVINPIASHFGIPVIEDGAQSFGSTHYGQRSCSLSTIGTTSFFPSKPLGCYGDGGALFTNDKDLAERIRRISRHGQSRRYFHTEQGINGRIDTIQAAILLAKLEVFDSEVQARQRLGTTLTTMLNSYGISQSPYVSPENTSVYAQYTIQVPNRDAFIKDLQLDGIPTAVHYPTLLCMQPSIAMRPPCQARCHSGCSTPVSLSISQRVVSLPFHPYLTDSDLHNIVSAVATAYSSSSRSLQG